MRAFPHGSAGSGVVRKKFGCPETAPSGGGRFTFRTGRERIAPESLTRCESSFVPTIYSVYTVICAYILHFCASGRSFAAWSARTRRRRFVNRWKSGVKRPARGAALTEWPKRERSMDESLMASCWRSVLHVIWRHVRSGPHHLERRRSAPPTDARTAPRRPLTNPFDFGTAAPSRREPGARRRLRRAPRIWLMRARARGGGQIDAISTGLTRRAA
jgi:hypothetical protein